MASRRFGVSSARSAQPKQTNPECKQTQNTNKLKIRQTQNTKAISFASPSKPRKIEPNVESVFSYFKVWGFSVITDLLNICHSP